MFSGNCVLQFTIVISVNISENVNRFPEWFDKFFELCIDYCANLVHVIFFEYIINKMTDFYKLN